MHVSLSSEVLPEFREYERFSTTAADAYLAPKLAAYFKNLAEQGGGGRRAGPPDHAVLRRGGAGRRRHQRRRGLRPLRAGRGVVGAAYVGSLGGYHDLLTFDMGGTTRTWRPSSRARRRRPRRRW